MKRQGLISAASYKARFVEALGMNNPTLSSALFLIFFLVTLGWFGDSLMASMQALLGIQSNIWAKVALGLLPFVSMLIWAGWRWKSLQHHTVQLAMETENVLPHKVVIMFLSAIQNPKYIERLEKADDTVLEAEYFSWKPCQRGLEAHQPCLQKVWVVCSPESAKQYPWFKRMFSPLFAGVSFHQVQVKSFEHIGSLVQSLEDIYANLPKDIDETDVVIDVTSGQKPASIAGMMVSLVNANRQVQYVQTNEPFEVKKYTYEINMLGKDFQ